MKTIKVQEHWCIPPSIMRGRNIDIKHHQVREAAEDGIITVKYISTNDQLADIMTKALNGKRFHEFRKQLGIQKRGVLVSS